MSPSSAAEPSFQLAPKWHPDSTTSFKSSPMTNMKMGTGANRLHEQVSTLSFQPTTALCKVVFSQFAKCRLHLAMEHFLCHLKPPDLNSLASNNYRMNKGDYKGPQLPFMHYQASLALEVDLHESSFCGPSNVKS